MYKKTKLQEVERRDIRLTKRRKKKYTGGKVWVRDVTGRLVGI